MVVHTENRQLKINWNLIQETSDDDCEFSSAEKGVLNTHTPTHTLDTVVLRCENASVFASLLI